MDNPDNLGDVDALTRESRALVEQISGILAGRHPSVIGATLSDLVSMLIAGHHPTIREELMASHVKLVWDLLPANHQWVLREHNGQWPMRQ